VKVGRGKGPSVFRRMNANRQSKSWCARVCVYLCVCICVCWFVCVWVFVLCMDMNAPCCVLSRDSVLHDMRTYTALPLAQCYDWVHRLDLSNVNLTIVSLTITTRQARSNSTTLLMNRSRQVPRQRYGRLALSLSLSLTHTHTRM
jgi:hypothetical protein